MVGAGDTQVWRHDRKTWLHEPQAAGEQDAAQVVVVLVARQGVVALHEPHVRDAQYEPAQRDQREAGSETRRSGKRESHGRFLALRAALLARYAATYHHGGDEFFIAPETFTDDECMKKALGQEGGDLVVPYPFSRLSEGPRPLSEADAALLDGKKVIVVMPAYNAARTLRMTWEAIPHEWVDLVILVDDHSRDETLDVARELSLDIVAHSHNVGYGGNQKTCYVEALRRGADVVVMLHPDGQYDPILIPSLVRPIVAGEADMVLGSRFLSGGTLAGGMPRYKYVANRFLTTVENKVLRERFSELHTGYRAYSREFLEAVPFLRNANDFSFDTQIIAQAVAFHQRVQEVPVSSRYFDDASSATISQSVVYGLETLGVMARFAAHRAGVVRSRLFLP